MARKAAAADDLAVVIAILHERGLLDAGLKVARDADIWGIVWHDPSSPHWDQGTRGRLAEARQVLLAEVDPELLPATLIVLGRAVVALPGGASVGEIYPDPHGWELR